MEKNELLIILEKDYQENKDYFNILFDNKNNSKSKPKKTTNKKQ